ncbi:potassium transporter family protein [Corchorus olitorius]|uniref:Potassium transporter family protein n=1 Tax=Corchorus olitorius TaxID=93759 RepID=A0A1R3KMD2_9ROSI|nr:potassium transporter family protein [Corchorus olitorius]
MVNQGNQVEPARNQPQQLQQLELMQTSSTHDFLMKEDLFPLITHTDVSKEERISETIEIQTEEKYLQAKEIVAKLESFKQKPLDFDPDEADEPCILVHKEAPKEEAQIAKQEEEFMPKPKRGLEIVVPPPFPSHLIKRKKKDD